MIASLSRILVAERALKISTLLRHSLRHDQYAATAMFELGVSMLRTLAVPADDIRAHLERAIRNVDAVHEKLGWGSVSLEQALADAKAATSGKRGA